MFFTSKYLGKLFIIALQPSISVSFDKKFDHQRLSKKNHEECQNTYGAHKYYCKDVKEETKINRPSCVFICLNYYDGRTELTNNIYFSVGNMSYVMCFSGKHIHIHMQNVYINVYHTHTDINL